jgi:hypothetical protein
VLGRLPTMAAGARGMVGVSPLVHAAAPDRDRTRSIVEAKAERRTGDLMA